MCRWKSASDSERGGGIVCDHESDDESKDLLTTVTSYSLRSEMRSVSSHQETYDQKSFDQELNPDTTRATLIVTFLTVTFLVVKLFSDRRASV